MTVTVARRSPAGCGDRPRAARRARASASTRSGRRRCRCSTPTRRGRPRVAARRPPRTTRKRSSARSSGSAPATLEKVVLAREVRVHAAAADRPGADPRCPARGLSRLLLLLRRHARAGVRRRQPRAARPPRRRTRADGRAGRHDPPQRRPGRRRPPRRAAAAQRQGPRASSAIVTERIERTLDPVSRLGRRAPTSRCSCKVQNVQHLATPIRAQLAEPIAGARAGRAAPPDARRRRRAATPRAQPLIPALEGLDRGWYAGAGRLDRPRRGRRVLRRPALRAAARRPRPPLRRLRHRRRLRPGRRARRDRGQARRRCCRCSPSRSRRVAHARVAQPIRDGLATARRLRDVAARSARSRAIGGTSSARARVERRGSSAGVATRVVVDAGERGERGEVDPVGVATWLPRRRLHRRARRPAGSRRSRRRRCSRRRSSGRCPARRAASRPPTSCSSATSPISSERRSRRSRGGAGRRARRRRRSRSRRGWRESAAASAEPGRRTRRSGSASTS